MAKTSISMFLFHNIEIEVITGSFKVLLHNNFETKRQNERLVLIEQWSKI